MKWSFSWIGYHDKESNNENCSVFLHQFFKRANTASLTSVAMPSVACRWPTSIPLLSSSVPSHQRWSWRWIGGCPGSRPRRPLSEPLNWRWSLGSISQVSWRDLFEEARSSTRDKHICDIKDYLWPACTLFVNYVQVDDGFVPQKCSSGNGELWSWLN